MILLGKHGRYSPTGRNVQTRQQEQMVLTLVVFWSLAQFRLCFFIFKTATQSTKCEQQRNETLLQV